VVSSDRQSNSFGAGGSSAQVRPIRGLTRNTKAPTWPNTPPIHHGLDIMKLFCLLKSQPQAECTRCSWGLCCA